MRHEALENGTSTKLRSARMIPAAQQSQKCKHQYLSITAGTLRAKILPEDVSLGAVIHRNVGDCTEINKNTDGI